MRGLSTFAAASPLGARPITGTPAFGGAVAVERRCPCCGGPIGPDEILVDMRTCTVTAPGGSVELAPLEARIVDILIGWRGKGPLPKDRLISLLYSTADGGPGDADSAVEALISRIRHGRSGVRSASPELRRRRPGIRSIGLDIVAIRYLGYSLLQRTGGGQ